jgi:hypothetical protein
MRLTRRFRTGQPPGPPNSRIHLYTYMHAITIMNVDDEVSSDSILC